MPRPRRENQVRRRGFPAAFRPPAFASWASCPARGFRPSYDRPTAPPADGADPSGVSMFRTRKTRPGPGALCTPGTAVPARPRMHPMAAACRLPAAGPCHPGTATHPGMFSSRGISKGSLAFTPPGHSPHLRLPDGTGTLGLYPGLHTRLSRTQPRMPGRGRASGTGPGSRHRHQRPPSADPLNTSGITSQCMQKVLLELGTARTSNTLTVPAQEHFLRQAHRPALKPL
jgi:hypothetical protein